MIEEILNPKINFIPESERKEGVSAFLRVKNGEEFLKISIDSIINQIDELICVVNQSTDKTLQILEEIQSIHTDKVKIYEYKPDVFPAGSASYAATSPDSVNSLVFYYNFALSKTNYKYIFKFDDDEIFFPNVIKNFYEYCKNNNNFSIGLRGINLIDHKKKLYVNKKYETTNGKDTLFFKYNSSCIFIKNSKYEIFHSNLLTKMVINCFYHLKYCKSDRGQNNYDLENNPDSRYVKIGENFLKEIKKDLIPIEKFINKKYISPFDLGFNFINDSIKKYNYKSFNEIENND